ncbi:MAG: DNA-directed RNA polymerase subunit alpha [Candidatus Sungbacteria bacterium]|nr:DNA-directed RNA polymerase subunit alpha [bacterium]MDZ4260109.1 DNA-directed RNA polymerase subunit alpha [Candidatus Sungbacteria bacterium]
MIPLPSKPKVVSEEGNRSVFEIAGLYPGYGQTIGNSLRRVLLSSLEGAVITSVKIEGVGHEFSTLEGVMEDMIDLILNLKQMRFKLHEPGPFSVQVSVKGEKEVTGKDFQTPSQVEVVTQDVHIATLTSKKSIFVLEAVVELGRGFVPVEGRTKEKVEIGTIALDALYSPVRHVNYEVEDMRVADRTDYNRLRLDIETDGSITPRDAFHKAAEILVEQFRELSTGFELATQDIPHAPIVKEKEESGEDEAAEEEEVFKTKLDTLKLSSRTLNALREAGIKTVGGASRKREETLREIEGLGDKGIQEIKKALGNFGITLKQ